MMCLRVLRIARVVHKSGRATCCVRHWVCLVAGLTQRIAKYRMSQMKSPCLRRYEELLRPFLPDLHQCR
jgi:hypothetical protein